MQKLEKQQMFQVEQESRTQLVPNLDSSLVLPSFLFIQNMKSNYFSEIILF